MPPTQRPYNQVPGVPTQPPQTPKKSVMPVLLIVVLVLVLGIGAYILFTGKKDQPTNEVTTSTPTPNQETNTNKPTITSITPSSGAAGTIVDIQGANLSGFEGDLIAVFKKQDDKTVQLHSTVPYLDGPNDTSANTTLLRVKVAPPCQPGETVYGDYSGEPSTCDYFEFTPGTYQVYVEPWGEQSNQVTFTVTN